MALIGSGTTELGLYSWLVSVDPWSNGNDAKYRLMAKIDSVHKPLFLIRIHMPCNKIISQSNKWYSRTEFGHNMKASLGSHETSLIELTLPGYPRKFLYILFASALEVREKWQLAISWQYLINPTIVLGCSPIFLLWEIRRSCLFKSVRFNVVPNWLTFASVSHWFKFSVPPQKWDARNYYNLVHKSAVTMLAFEWTKKNIKH